MFDIDKQIEFATGLRHGIYETMDEMKSCLKDFFTQYSEDPDAADSDHFIDTITDMALNMSYLTAIVTLEQLGIVDSDIKYAL